MRRSSLLPVPVVRYLRVFDRSPLGTLWVVTTILAGALLAPYLIVPMAAGVLFFAWHRATLFAKPRIERASHSLHAHDLSRVVASLATVVCSLVLLFLGSKWWLIADEGADATALLILLGLGISAGFTMSVLMNWRLPLGFLALTAVFVGGLWTIAASGPSMPVEIDPFTLLVRLLLIQAVAIVADSVRYRHFRWSHGVRSAWWVPATALASTYLLGGASKSVTNPLSPWWVAGMMAATVVSVVWVARATSRRPIPTVGMACTPMLGWASLSIIGLAPIASSDIWSVVFVMYALTAIESLDSIHRTRVSSGAKTTVTSAKPRTNVMNQAKALSLPKPKTRQTSPVVLCLKDEK